MYLPARNKTSWLWHLFNDYLIFYAFDEYMEIFLNWVFKLPIKKKVVFLLNFWTATLKSIPYMKKEINDYKTTHENVTMIEPGQIITLVNEDSGY